MVVADIMTAEPITADATDTVRSVLSTLLEMDIRHLPIVNDGQLVGIISDRDLKDVQTPILADDADIVQQEARLEQPASRVMSSDVITVDPETELSEVVSLMVEHRVGAIPVVSPNTHSLVGIVSYIDVLKAAGDAL
jgi:CBS domain-containing protein